MKTKSFMSFLQDYVKSMNPEHSLSLFKTEKYVDSDLRLLNLFSFYVLLNKDVTNTLLQKKDKLPKLYEKYVSYKKLYNNVTLDNLEEKVKTLDSFDELKQVYTSYLNLMVNKNLVLKKLYHQKILKIKLEKNISNYRIYTDLKLNQGNTNDFLKNKKFEKLSVMNVKKIADFVTSV